MITDMSELVKIQLLKELIGVGILGIGLGVALILMLYGYFKK